MWLMQCILMQVDSDENPAEGAAEWPVHVLLSNGNVHGVDFVVSATGVTPSTQWLPAKLDCNPRCALLQYLRLCFLMLHKAGGCIFHGRDPHYAVAARRTG